MLGRKLGPGGGGLGLAHASVPTGELDKEVESLVDTLAHGPTVASTPRVAAGRAVRHARRAVAARGPGAGAVVTQRGLPRGPVRLRDKRPPTFEGTMTTSTQHRRTDVGLDTSPDRAAATRACRRPRAGRGGRRRPPAGRRAIRKVRSRADYEACILVFAGLVVLTWPVEYGGLGVGVVVAKAIEAELASTTSGASTPWASTWRRLALFAHGTEEQRLRYLPPIVRNEEVWCRCSASPAPGPTWRPSPPAERDGDGWRVTGQKVDDARTCPTTRCSWRGPTSTSPAAAASRTSCSTSTSPASRSALRHIGGERTSTRCSSTAPGCPTTSGSGPSGTAGRRRTPPCPASAKMVSGAGSGGVDRIGGSGAERLVVAAQAGIAGLPGGADDPVVRQRLGVRSPRSASGRGPTSGSGGGLRAGRSPGPESSIGKVHQGDLNQRIQLLATDLLGAAALAWEAAAGLDAFADGLPYEVKGMLRSRANTIEGGTTEVNKNVVAERVLGLPASSDPGRRRCLA